MLDRSLAEIFEGALQFRVFLQPALEAPRPSYLCHNGFASARPEPELSADLVASFHAGTSCRLTSAS